MKDCVSHEAEAQQKKRMMNDEKNVLPRIPSHGDIIIQHSLVIFYVV